jgi:hypothetical protein
MIGMKWLRTAIPLAFAALLGFGATALFQRIKAGRETTTSRLSPDETIRARLVETSPSWHLDRNFRVQLDSLVEGTSTVIFGSPDEGRPEGTERLIWSKDGAWLLLVGRHFFVKDDLFLDNGDQLYFLYHLPTRRAWCNAETSGLALLKAETIEGLEFTEPVKLKPRRADPGGVDEPA